MQSQQFSKLQNAFATAPIKYYELKGALDENKCQKYNYDNVVRHNQTWVIDYIGPF
jgi:hypothetical protein